MFLFDDYDFNVDVKEKKEYQTVIKKEYHKLAKKYHPDKVTHLGVELQELAEEKFKAVNNAYKDIKLERGMK